ncbi:MAG: diguanylate cyclase [Cognaticolwellia sp.]
MSISSISKIAIFLLYTMSFTSIAISETKLDLENEIRELLIPTRSYEFLRDYKRSQSLMSELLEKVSIIDDEPLILEVHYANILLADSQTSVNDFTSSLKIVLALSEKLKDYEKHALAITIKGTFYQEKEDIVQEIASFKSAIDYANKHNLKQVKSGNLNNLGGRYFYLELYDQALKYFQEASAINSSPLVIRNIAMTHMMLGELDKAENTLAAQKKINPLDLIVLSAIYVKKKDFEKAKQQLSKIRQDYQPLPSAYSAYAALAEAKLYYSLQKYDIAVKLFEEGFRSNDYIAPSEKQNNLYLLSDSYFKLQNYLKAARTYNQWALLKNSLDENRRKQTMLLLLAEFNLELEVNKKESVEKDLLLANDKLASNEKIKELQIFITFLSIAITLLIAFLFYKQSQKNKLLNEFAHTDMLTKIKNRRSIILYLENKIKSLKNNDLLCVAMLDIDHFKRINDNFGHDVGDKVLCAFSSFVSTFLRKSDTFGRFGGEEFLIIFNDTNIAQSKAILERLVIELSDFEFSEVGNVTFSAGLAQYSNQDIKTLIIEADEKLYTAKNSGRNQVAA